MAPSALYTSDYVKDDAMSGESSRERQTLAAHSFHGGARPARASSARSGDIQPRRGIHGRTTSAPDRPGNSGEIMANATRFTETTKRTFTQVSTGLAADDHSLPSSGPLLTQRGLGTSRVEVDRGSHATARAHSRAVPRESREISERIRGSLLYCR